MIKQTEIKRSFGGKLFVHVDKQKSPTEDRWEKNFEKAHLKAYLKGYPSFFYGKDIKGKPIRHIVKEILTNGN